MSSSVNKLESLYYKEQSQKFIPRDDDLRSPSVLIVEDDPMMRRSLSELLQSQKFSVIEASTNKEAKNCLSENYFNIVLVDLNLPDDSGKNLIDYINKKNINIHIIVVSGEANFENATHALQRNVYDFIKKPFNVTHLLKTVKEASKSYQKISQIADFYKKEIFSKEISSFIIENSPDFIYLLDDSGFFTYVNRKAYELLNYHNGELLGLHYSSIIYEGDLHKAQYVFNERRTGERATQGVEIRLKKFSENTLDNETPHFIYTELFARGMYRDDSVRRQNFVGTYGVIRDLTERIRSEDLIRFHLYHDSLTSLPNRTLFNDRLHMALLHAKRNKKKFSLLFLDLDNFKKINDNLGHQSGDEVLQNVAKILKKSVRESDTISRIGGDEFVILIENLDKLSETDKICYKILNAFKEPMYCQDQEVRITASIGIAVYPEHGQTKEQLMRRADMAMYKIKSKTQNSFCYYSNKDNGSCYKNLPSIELENDLYMAIENNELAMFYQPQVDCENETIVGFEALMRWFHPKFGLVSPSVFIAIAEKNGLINELGRWGLQQTCKDALYFEEKCAEPMKFSFNISAKQIHQSNFIDETLSIVNSFDLKENSIELEITESSVMHNLNAVSYFLMELRKSNISIAIDDFGSGFSSLSYLQNLFVDTLKLDRSFISNADLNKKKRTIFTAIQSMAHSLNVDLVIEGVENFSQKQYLKDLGLDSIIQGYYYSKPMSLEDLEKSLFLKYSLQF
ncbi:EAL domain-containing protein [Desulfohalobium retbaense]|uniref:Response regulator receiver modulated diguanylate cyclase/phosphodiesterase with PAS/PAC sensor(S) n=1 Tax=Desulfohalobium retbaense (strain ATCC 49708 / DSM 5692 / JCM 16813 / HR100) TaxID=485915 RepID=C8X1Q0_DESRD|nr:EAL domain-containing protein [Desulfohalobium retbaense]ACV68472.1 response regulator receiver modulated diguanylate cyclase/phosphodiesterase with PAS/PAC sensor(s) [Desulfohalobium retbaense DSM 5692]